jgi:type I restriction enzyme S subunit
MNENTVQLNETKPLPQGWRWVRLEDMAKEFVTGGTPSTDVPKYWGGDIPWITGADVTGIWVSGGRKFITKEGLDNSAAHLVNRGTILIVSRTGVGKTAIAANSLSFSQDITAVVCNDEILPEYLARYLIFSGDQLVRIQRGATIKGLTRTDIETVVIPLAPLPEQKRIVAKIQELMAEVERARSACEAQLEAIKALPQAILSKAFEGEM